MLKISIIAYALLEKQPRITVGSKISWVETATALDNAASISVVTSGRNISYICIQTPHLKSAHLKELKHIVAQYG